MESDWKSEKIRRIRAFVEDKERLQNVIATANRIIRRCAYGNCEKAITAEDVVSELITDALCGGPRKWNIDKMPEIDGWIITQLRSVMSNLMRKEIRPLSSDFEADRNETITHQGREFIRPGVSLEKEIEEKGFDPPAVYDHKAEYERTELVDALKKRIEGNMIDYSVLNGVLDRKSNLEIASDLKLQTKEVVNAKKRIKREIDRLLRDTDGSDRSPLC